MRTGSKSTNLSNVDKLFIHLRYLLTQRFEESFEQIFKLIETFMHQIGNLFEEQSVDLLHKLSQMKIKRTIYPQWA